MREIIIDANTGNLGKVLEFVDNFLEERGCSPKTKMQIDIAVEEIFVNIASYACGGKKGSALVRADSVPDPLSAVITFMDGGVPYDPLAKPDPDITLPAGERPVGGLGIYMVKKSMDKIKYEYKEGKNILTIQKKL